MEKKYEIDWVLQNELAIGPAPRDKEDLNYLMNEGITSILSLCSEQEVCTPKDIEKYFNFIRFFLPDHKFNKPPTLDQLEKCLDIISRIKHKGPVFVHCVASVERSPLVCMAWLVRQHKLNPQQSLDYLMDVHKGTNPLPIQFELLGRL